MTVSTQQPTVSLPHPWSSGSSYVIGGKAGGHILDAFAGGPPRGLVSTIMGYKYTGFEIRQSKSMQNVATLKALKLGGDRIYSVAMGSFLQSPEGETWAI